MADDAHTASVSLSPLNIIDTKMTTTVESHEGAATPNLSLQDGCLTLQLSEMEFIPWDNPDNVISAEAEEIIRRVMDFVLVSLFLIGGPGNVINMAVFYKQGIRDRVNLCLFALALADELYFLIAMFHLAEHVHLQFTTKVLFGPMITFITNNHLLGLVGFLYVSPVLTAIIASERCYCVLRPLQYQSLMRTRTMAIIIAVVYITVVGLYFIVALRFHIGCVKDPATGVTVKTAIMGELYKANKLLVDSLDSFVFGVGLPGIVMIVVITATVITIVKLRQIVTWRAGTSSAISCREIALTKMLVGTSILFMICVFPLAVTPFSWLFLPEVNAGRRNHNLFLASLWINQMLTYVNSSLNIVVYYVMGSRYRETFWGLFARKPGSKRKQDG